MSIICGHTKPFPEQLIRFIANGQRSAKTLFQKDILPGTNSKSFAGTLFHDFDSIEILDIKKPRVGVVGEILVKFLPAANNHLVELLEAEGAEAVVPDLADFLQYCFYNQNFKVSHLGMKKSKALAGRLGVQAVEWFRSPATKAFAESKHFSPPAKIEHLAEMAS